RLARGLERRDRVRSDRSGLPLVGGDADSDPSACAGAHARGRAWELAARGARRLQDGLAGLSAASDRRAIRSPDAGLRLPDRADRGGLDPVAWARLAGNRLPELCP